jgi:2-polyprenyl-6-methoxyphenol hydroxylase-like FAD-dependent oxidoreductase
VRYPFIAFIPQWDFVNFLVESGRRYPSLKVMMHVALTDLIHSGEAVSGVRVTSPDGPLDIQADLTVACDGRHSIMRQRAGLAVEEIGAPMDVLWFRAGKSADAGNVFARLETGRMMVTFDRGDCWQCAYVIAKGQYEMVKARGLEAFRADVVRMAPALKDGVAEVGSWDDIKLLTVAINRPPRWTAQDYCASAMPRMRCRRSAASASISRCRTRWRQRTCFALALRRDVFPKPNLTLFAAAANFR